MSHPNIYQYVSNRRRKGRVRYADQKARVDELYSRLFTIMHSIREQSISDADRFNELTRHVQPTMMKILRIVRSYFDADPEGYVQEQKDIYGLYPGQEIARPGGFGSERVHHHGIYLGEGLVAEVAAIMCPIYLKKVSLLWQVKNKFIGKLTNQCFGLTSLREFHEVGLRNGFDFLLVKYEGMDDSNINVIRNRLDRLQKMIEKSFSGYPYNPFTNNCQHASSEIASGVCAAHQIPWDKGVPSTKHPVDREPTFDEEECGGESECAYRIQTQRGCVCTGDVMRSLRGKYCHVDPSCSEAQTDSSGQAWDWVNAPNTTAMCKQNNEYKVCKNPLRRGSRRR